MPRQIPTELKLDKSSNRAFVRFKGRKLYFGDWGTRAAQKAFAKWLLEVIEHPTAPATKDRITVTECVECYLVFAERYYSENGVPTQEFLNVAAAMKVLLQLFGEDLAADFGPKKLKEIQRHLASEKTASDDPAIEPKLKYGRKTINSRIDRIRRCFRWCASEELIPADVSIALGTVAGLAAGRGMARESTPVRPVDLQTVQATLKWLSPTVATMIQVQFLCGMRPQDVCGMTTGALDQSGDVWIYRPQHHKNSHRGQQLAKAVPQQAQDLIRPLLRKDPDEPLFSPLDTKRHFNNAGKKAVRGPYTTASYGKSIIYAIAKAAKAKVTIPHWSPNQLRHSIGTEVRRTSGIEAAQAYLGHSKPDATLIYAERTEQALRELGRGIVSPLGQEAPEPEQT